MGMIRFVVAMLCALVAGFLLIGPAVVTLLAVMDAHAPLQFHGGWPIAVGGVLLGAGLLAASARLVART